MLTWVAMADKTTPPTHEHEEETPPAAKRAKGLAAILKKVPMRSPIELTSHQRATKEIVAYSDLPLEETGSQACHELFVFIV